MNRPRMIMVASGIVLAASALAAYPGAVVPSNDPKTEAGPGEPNSAERADKRYQEMLGRMQASIEEIAQLYGNPVFLQVFTNDVERASELKRRLRSARSGDEIEGELQRLERRRSELRDDIALKER